MKKYIQPRLRDSEFVYKVEQVSTRVKNKMRDCHLAIISNNANEAELALFLFKPSTMFIINNKLDLLVVMPICKELNMIQGSNGFAFRWLDFPDTQWEINTSNLSLYNEIKNHLADVSIYQREPFTAGSPTHQWLWYYEVAMPVKIRTSSEISEREFIHRESSALLPQHFGKKIMQAYIREQLKKYESQYITYEEISIYIGSWNCAGLDPAENVESWLRPERNENDGEDYDLIVISLQEICKLNTKNILGSEASAEKWTDFIKVQISKAFGNRYELKITQNLVGLLSLIFVNVQVLRNMKNTSTQTIKLGLRGYTGNKGALCMRFEYFDSSFIIINSHLAAHKSKVKSRNEHIKSILKKTVFNVSNVERKIYEHDHIFWTGDMNYRIQGLDHNEITNLISRGDFQKLQQYDQLNIEKKSGRVLVDFSEGLLQFPPTFKYKKYTTDYSTEREPSWCDRILWRGDSKILAYGSSQDIIQSDHKPIFGIFKVTTKIADTTTLRYIENKLLEDISKQRHESLPKIKLIKSEFYFKKVFYKVPQESSLDITNTGKNLVLFSVCYDKTFSWLNVFPLDGSIGPNESFSISLKVLFKEKEAQFANYHTCTQIAHIKIRIVNGCEYNIEVHSEFAGSCFGANFIDLAKVTCPIVDLKTTIKDNTLTSNSQITIPKEFVRIIEFIKNNSIEGLFDKNPEQSVIEEIRLALDKSEAFSDRVDNPAMINVLIEMLDSMPNSLVRTEVIDSVAMSESKDTNHAERSGILCKFDPVNVESFFYIVDFFKWLVGQNSEWIEYVVEMFMYPIMHIKRVEASFEEGGLSSAGQELNRSVVSNASRKRVFINLIKP